MKTTRGYLFGIFIFAVLLMTSGISFAAMESRVSVSDGKIAKSSSSAPGYCESYGGIITYEYITSVSYTKNPSGTMTITVNVYITNQCGCTYGEPCGCYDNSPEYVHVWVDWNGDKVFGDDEKVIDDALTGYTNINYRGSMTSSHVVSVPSNAVNNTWMRANLGWGYDPNDPCESYWTYGNVVDKEIGTLIPPSIKDINITGPLGNESYPMTTQDVKLEAIITEAEGYEVYKIEWWGDVENVEGPIDTYNPYTYIPAGGKHGKNKIAVATIYYRNTQTGEGGINTKSRLFNLFFEKYGDDDGDGEPNWFDYWGVDGAVPNLVGANYNPSAKGYGYCTADGKVYVKPKAAGQHYPDAIVLNTHFGEESFGGPNVIGIYSVAEVIAHELYHRWVGNQWNSSGQFYNKTDSDKNYKPAEVDSEGDLRSYNDRLPDFYETSTSYTSPINDTDTYNLEEDKHEDYRFYGDEEYMAMRTGNEGRVNAMPNKDWAHPGKQTTEIGTASVLPALRLSKPKSNHLPDGKFTGNYGDNGNDTNSNGLYDYLTFNVEINITVGGSFTALAFLRNSGGGNITYVLKDIILDDGIQNIEFNFEGITLRENGIDGPYTVSASITNDYVDEGWSVSRKDYNTSAYKSADFETNAASFTGNYTENATDINDDGIYEYLAIDTGLNVATAGTYKLEGWLYDSSGNDIAYASNSGSIGIGKQSMKLNFSGSAIGNSRVNGPYKLKYLKLTDSTGKQVDFVPEAYNTSAYTYSQFKEYAGGAKFRNTYRDYGSDINLDKMYDYIIIEVGLNVTNVGNYTLTGILYDKNSNNISMASTESSLKTGNQTMLLNFNGDDVYKNMVDGPYILKYLILQNNNGTQADYLENAYNTTAYNYTDFASKPLVSLTGNYSDNGLDTNNDILYDYLIIGVGVQVASNGNVIISARLMTSNGNEIQWAGNTSYLYENQTNTMLLRFNGTLIHDSLINGPYQLKDLYMYHTGDLEKSVYVANAYNTSVYSYTAFFSSGTTTTTTTITTTTTLPECKKGDEDCNGIVSDFELLDCISEWANGLFADFDLLEAINNWSKVG